MTAHSRTPIYARKDLAALVAEHDREHPDHGPDCGCRNGLIWTLRIYFAPAVSVGGSGGPPPYVPPDVLPPRGPDVWPADSPEVIERKPWLQRRTEETSVDYDFRISHSCYNCGMFIVDSAALNQHEDQHGRRQDGSATTPD